MIVTVDVTDPEQYRQYTDRSPAAIAAFGGRFLARGGQTVTLEGETETRRIVVVEFPSRERAEAWYNSEAYQKILPLRTGSSQCNLVIIDGVD